MDIELTSSICQKEADSRVSLGRIPTHHSPEDLVKMQIEIQLA